MPISSLLNAVCAQAVLRPSFLYVMCVIMVVSRMKAAELEQDDMMVEKRFPKIVTCTTDLDCVHMNIESCCARSQLGPFRVCKPLGKFTKPCNVNSSPWPRGNHRVGRMCPCSPEYVCANTLSTDTIGICLI